MGAVEYKNSNKNIMKVIVCLSTLLVAASAAPQFLGGHLGHAVHGPVVAAGYHGRPAGQVSHQSVSKPYQGEHRSTTQSKAFGASVAAVADSPNRLHGARGVVAPAPVYHAPIVHAAPAYPDEPSPYTYTYAVADDYSNSNFNAAETGDGAGNAVGSYSVALPDGRTQHVNYKADGYEGYVADVTYDGTAAYPPVAVAPAYHAAPVVHAAPVYHG